MPAFLVLVNFLNDADMKGPTTAEVWQAAYEVAFHVMGLGRRSDLCDATSSSNKAWVWASWPP